AALWYAKYNWHVFPVVPKSKEPLTPNGYKDGTTDPDQIRAWWAKWPDANIGLACDKSGVIAIDGDPKRYNEETEALLNTLRREYPTTRQGTPTKGEHFIYMLPPDVELSNSSGQLPPGLDVRVHGYILLHPSGGEYHGDKATEKGVEDGYYSFYRWHEWPHEIPPQPLPECLLELLKKKQEPRPTPPPPSNGHVNGNGSGHHKSY